MMKVHNLPKHLIQAHRLPRVTATVVVALALFSTGCSDPASSVIAPPLLAVSNGGPSAAALKFGVLANAGVTCTNGTIKGNVGTFLPPGTGSVTRTGCPIAGTIHVGDVASQQAYNSFLSTYVALAPKRGDDCRMLTGTLGGKSLKPGTYCFAAAATLTGVLTLNGPSTKKWNFKVGTGGSGGLTTTNLTMVLAGGARACNVTWWVAEGAATTTSDFKGTILSGTYIALTGGTFNGNAWAKADATITGTAFTAC